VGFCAVGTGRVDFSLGGHGCTELSLRRGGLVRLLADLVMCGNGGDRVWLGL
jgi:hypothetical protein